mmetsp:Transcript_42157/g.126212  ORF Transcript_42157/g.126212 Transcript_42157/m.126212 type:complete len:502 (-) Transcript_42157:923-2428(-)
MPFAGKQHRQKVPVTIITGFLGAGKTTLLNHLLKERGTKSIAVIENEFGEVNIDRQLVADNLLQTEDLISLENGCVCCSLRKDIVKAFAEIERRSRERDKPVDAIIMETTGLADPAPVAFTFFANPWVASRFKLDSIICVVDSRHLLQHLDDDARPAGSVNEALQQIAFSDLVLLNKTDLVSEEQKATVLATIRKINGTARLLEVQLNDLDKRPNIDSLLGINSFSINRALELDPTFLESDSEESSDQHQDQTNNVSTSEAVDDAANDGAATAGTTFPADSADEADDTAASKEKGQPSSKYAGKKHKLDHSGEPRASPSTSAGPCTDQKQPRRVAKKLHDLSNVSSVGITARGALDEHRFNMFMRDLLSEKASDIFRCKGVLSVHGYPDQKFVFQGVHETICYGPCDKGWSSTDQQINQIVFIGRHLDRKALIEGLRTCVWVPLPEGWEEVRDPKTSRCYFYNKASGVKQWERPTDMCAHVVASHASTKQPSSRLPREVEG